MPRPALIRLIVATLFALPFSAALARGCPPLPSEMRAARAHQAGGPEVLRIESVPLPTLGPDEVLVRVHFASINPVDWKLQQAGRLPVPAIPGGDFAGTVVAVGERVEGVACGDEVAGSVDQVRGGGSYAEYVSAPTSAFVSKPAQFDFAEAAAYPTVAVAAWRFLVVAADLQPGERVLVHGGAGGVGSMAVQIAKARGAYVIATASAANHAFLHELGADELIDYRTTRFEDAATDLDVVLDTVGGETTARSASVLRSGGRLVTLVGRVPEALCASGQIVCPAVGPWDVQRGLAYVAPLITEGKLRVNIDHVYSLEQIREAQQSNRDGHTRGKIVIDLGVDAASMTQAAPRSAVDQENEPPRRLP
jgi:NADPH:quinone reductase-like Zn-dependent oxidoreductase